MSAERQSLLCDLCSKTCLRDSSSSNTFPPSPPRGAFPTTHWSIVLRAGSGSESEVRAALETLCRQYWYPLYAFARRQGRAHHEAEDCTQEFLARLLAAEGMAAARPERGRFRTFLLAALRNFLVNEWQRNSAAKRGGGIAPLSLQFETAEKRFALDPPDSALTPDQNFDRDWALDLADLVIAELRAEYALSGRGALFEILGPRVWSTDDSEPMDQVAARAWHERTGFSTSRCIACVGASANACARMWRKRSPLKPRSRANFVIWSPRSKDSGSRS